MIINAIPQKIPEGWMNEHSIRQVRNQRFLPENVTNYIDFCPFFWKLFCICFPIKKTEKEQIWSSCWESEKISRQKDRVNEIKENPPILFTLAEHYNKICKKIAETLIYRKQTEIDHHHHHDDNDDYNN